MQLGTFTANIIVDGMALEEYDVVFDGPTRATCWIASEEGKRFSVQWKCHEESRAAGATGRVCVDGIKCGQNVITPGTLGVEDTRTLSHFISSTSKRGLMFARVQLSDDDSLLDKGVHKNFGEICLEIRRGKVVIEPRPARSEPFFVPDNNERLHERSKKATVHCVGFGRENVRKVSHRKWRLVPNRQPKITFVFKYRPLDVLQANGLASRPTSTTTATSNESGSGEWDARTPDDYMSEDVKPAQLNNRIQTLENELKRLRGLQTRNHEDRKPKQIKTEDSEKQSHVFAPTEIIDLT